MSPAHRDGPDRTEVARLAPAQRTLDAVPPESHRGDDLASPEKLCPGRLEFLWSVVGPALAQHLVFEVALSELNQAGGAAVAAEGVDVETGVADPVACVHIEHGFAGTTKRPWACAEEKGGEERRGERRGEERNVQGSVRNNKYEKYL